MNMKNFFPLCAFALALTGCASGSQRPTTYTEANFGTTARVVPVQYAEKCAVGSGVDIRKNVYNLPHPDMGCAVRSNMALMIANAEDLQKARPLSPADAHRRKKVLQQYREGVDTGASTSVEGTQSLLD